MRKLLLIFLLLPVFVMPVRGLEITAPAVPEAGADLMPEETGSFSQGLQEIIKEALSDLRPDLAEASRICIGVVGISLLVSIVHAFPGNGKKAGTVAGTVAIGILLMQGTNSLVRLGAQTVTMLSEYGKLLIPVMTAALAAQGGVTSSAALYAGTIGFNAFLSGLLSKVLIPMVYIFLALSVGNWALGENTLKQMQELVKSSMTWTLKTVLTVFTTYIGITGVVSGTTDAASLKAAKMTISGVVPVVGGILSDASEAVLVSAGVVKNAAGIYGILAILAVFLGPFIKIGTHYLMLKLTGAICGIFGMKEISGIVSDFGSAMGLILAMTGAVCMLLLISAVCFLRGVG